jgi:hypothetical protein
MKMADHTSVEHFKLLLQNLMRSTSSSEISSFVRSIVITSRGTKNLKPISTRLTSAVGQQQYPIDLSIELFSARLTNHQAQRWSSVKGRVSRRAQRADQTLSEFGLQASPSSKRSMSLTTHYFLDTFATSSGSTAIQEFT